MIAFMRARETNVPMAGDDAPGFELTRLSGSGVPGEATLSLAGLRGKPVALVFGSYT